MVPFRKTRVKLNRALGFLGYAPAIQVGRQRDSFDTAQRRSSGGISIDRSMPRAEAAASAGDAQAIRVPLELYAAAGGARIRARDLSLTRVLRKGTIYTLHSGNKDARKKPSGDKLTVELDSLRASVGLWVCADPCTPV